MSEGEPLGELDQLGEGVKGYLVEEGDVVYVPLIVADAPGTGQVARWLEQLDPARTWKIPNVTSARLLGMLRRRGWEGTSELDPWSNEQVDVYVRRAVPKEEV